MYTDPGPPFPSITTHPVATHQFDGYHPNQRHDLKLSFTLLARWFQFVLIPYTYVLAIVSIYIIKQVISVVIQSCEFPFFVSKDKSRQFFVANLRYLPRIKGSYQFFSLPTVPGIGTKYYLRPCC